MALIHYYQNQESNHILYFTEQVASLNKAFIYGKYDDDGNGIYESYRAGRRIHNWLFCHAAYMSDSSYTIDRQSLLIRTFLHHGAYLFEHLPLYKPGNHHTKGLVALFEISTIFNDFIDSEKWQSHALKGIIEHMHREINSDGFQFERSVHYHKGDIENYFRVYQLAQRTQTELPLEFTQAFQKMFDALIILAQPNNKLPVLQDDTDSPFTENNEMGDVFYLASVMFDKPEYAYFSSGEPPVKLYWLMNSSETIRASLQKKQPEVLSNNLPQTGYYVMRDGWDEYSLHMVFSAGLSDVKPDHQHGDMLGITMFGLGTELLANYQVAYKYPDFSFWKNSWAKNVALVDSQLQGRKWIPNRGGSGFGKWGKLPKPTVTSWIKNEEFDYIAVSHDGFQNLAINYSREAIFIKGNYWLITDNFSGEGLHRYQQVWQGKYKIDSNSQVSREIKDKGIFYITQLEDMLYEIDSKKFRDKQNLVFSAIKDGAFTFNTLLYPAKSNEYKPIDLWLEDDQSNTNFISNAKNVLLAGRNYLLLDVSEIKLKDITLQLSQKCKIFVVQNNDEFQLSLLHQVDISYKVIDINKGTFNENDWETGKTKIFSLVQKP